MRIAIKTLGCKVNQAESDTLIDALVGDGFEVVDFTDRSDLYLINGCAVTGEAERKTRQMVSQALRRNPHALVLLTGCAAWLLQRERKSPWDDRVVILPTSEKEKEVREYLRNFRPKEFSFSGKKLFSRVRNWVKVEDGCDHFCSYCIVPFLRGRVRSEPLPKIIQKVQDLEKKGAREIVLCGINLGYFGCDIASSILELLEVLLQKTTVVRFRLSSLEPFLLDEDFIERYFSLGRRVCPHFHLPLQSGSDRILKNMKRGYDTAYYRSLVQVLRRMAPDGAVTTDVMVGFPGETAEDFEQTIRFCMEMEFARMHVFLFSPRPGTLAFQWEKEIGIPYVEKKRREKVLLDLAERSRRRYHERFLGRDLEVVVESFRNSLAMGYSENYIPVRLVGASSDTIGTVLKARVQKVEDGWVIGEVLENKKDRDGV